MPKQHSVCTQYPLLPVGLLGFKNGEALANVCSFTLRILAEAGMPVLLEHVIDPVVGSGADHCIGAIHHLS